MQIDVAPRRKRSVSLTPLIDVVFNLLLFFMLASSLARWSGLELATGSAVATDDVPAANVYLLKTGEMRYHGETFGFAALAERLGREQEAGEISSVILRAEGDVQLGALIEGFDQLGHAGINALALGELAE